jgi:hypothetical protein
MRTRIKLFTSHIADNVEIAVDKFNQIIEAGGGEIVDIKFSSTDKTFDVLIIYKSL